METEAREVAVRSERSPLMYGEQDMAYLRWLVVLAVAWCLITRFCFSVRLRRRPMRTVGTQTREDKESLNRYTIEALRDELRGHELAVGGTKDVVIERLMRTRAMRFMDFFGFAFIFMCIIDFH